MKTWRWSFVLSRIPALALMVAAFAAVGMPPVVGAEIGVVFYDQRFGTLDDATGAYTQVSNLPITSASAGLTGLNGLYYLEDFGNNLFTVDPLTGAASKVGSSGMNLNAAAFAGTSTGLFEVDQASNLYSINAATGAATKVGATGIAPANQQYDTSMSGDGTWLYYTAGLGGQTDELYRIDVLTGIATDLGNTRVRGVAGSALVGGELELFQYGQAQNYIYSAIAGSASFTQGAQLASAAQIIDGGALLLSTDEGTQGATPEPNTFLLAGTALLWTGVALRRRIQRRKIPAPVRVRSG